MEVLRLAAPGRIKFHLLPFSKCHCTPTCSVWPRCWEGLRFLLSSPKPETFLTPRPSHPLQL